MLGRAGLELREDADADGGRYEVTGNTFAHKDLLKRVGGRWRATRQCWELRLARGDRAARGGAARQRRRRPRAASPMRRRPTTRTGRRSRGCASGRRTPATATACGPASSRPGADALPDYELLELLLFFSIDVKDTKPLAKELLARYGSLGAVLKAEPGQLAEFDDLQASSPEIDAYLAYRLSDDFQRDRAAAAGQLSEAGQRWRASSRTRTAPGRSSGCGAGARPRSCSRRSASCSSGCCARRSRTAR